LKRIAVVMTIGIAVGSMVRAGAERSQDASLRVERVALFKNGIAFLSSRATIPEKTRIVRLGQLPIPSYGTLWVSYPKEVSVRSLVTSLEEIVEQAPVSDVGHLVLANVGRRVTLRTSKDDQDVVDGVVMPGPEPPETEETPSPYFMEALRREPSRTYALNAPARANVLMIRTKNGTVALNAGSVLRADLEGNDVVTTVAMVHKRPSIRMELDRPAGRVPVSISCLARGATWAPGYLIDLSDPKTARFSAHAVIVNELTDMENVQLELVTGFPNIKFGDVKSPIAMSDSLSGFLNALAGGGSQASLRRSGVMTQQARLPHNSAVFDDFEAQPIPAYSSAPDGQVSGDLFLYPIKDFSLKRGETAWLPLFTADMPYQHVYTWTIDDYLDEQERYPNAPDRGDGRSAEEVWHSCRLVNTLKMPLTTAAAEFVTNGSFTGQDVCYYTAPNAETTIRINKAMNVLAEQDEIELERERNAATFHGLRYDLVTVQGTLRVRSRLEELVNMEITKELSGDVLWSEPKAVDVKIAKGLKQVNPKHRLTWKVKLTAGEERKLDYRYKVYIRG
jgi:hypothetical protein